MSDKALITTGARLHFGFFAHRPASAGPNYGGIGLMIDSPGVALAASRSDVDRIIYVDDSAGDAQVDLESTALRAADFVALYREESAPGPACQIEIRRAIAPHCGLGSGTQLGLAVARALSHFSPEGTPDVLALARRMKRGNRSAVGIHGFARGGFLVDAGKRLCDELGVLAARAEIPADWRFLQVGPPESAGKIATGLSGPAEVDAFEDLEGMPDELTDRLCRIAVLEMLPALAQSDVDRFGEAMFEFGRFVGQYFEPVQGGTYSDPGMAELVRWLRTEKIRGVAQTSWGPTIAVCCRDAGEAESLRGRILSESRWSSCQVHIAAPLNSGASIER